MDDRDENEYDDNEEETTMVKKKLMMMVVMMNVTLNMNMKHMKHT